MSQPPNELETIRQRARQAVEYYKRQVNSASADNGSQSGGSVRGNPSSSPFPPSSSSSAYHRSLDSEGGQEGVSRVGGQLPGQRSSMEDILHGGVAPASSNSFYRAKMKAGIIDMRSSYNERIGSAAARQRSRTFHGPHTGRTRTQTYAVDAHKGKPAVPGAKPKESPPLPQRPNVGSPPSPSPPQRYPTPQAAVVSGGGRVGGSSRRHSRGLYRSNSNLEMDSVECVEDSDLPPPSLLHREYGSTSSLDLLASAGQENYADMLKDFKNGHSPPREPRLRQILQQQQQQQQQQQHHHHHHKVVNGVVDKEEDEGSDQGKASKSKAKGKERKTRAKSITGDGSGSASILKKLRGTSSKHDSGDASTKSDDKCNEDSAAEERLRQKAFVHFDCQSVGVRLSKSGVKNQSLPNYMKNITTGASAASVKRNSYAVSGDRDMGEGVEDDDGGDGKSNDLVLSCPFFRNEVGGEGSVLSGPAPLTAYKHLAPTNSSSSSSSNSAMSPCPCVRHPACSGVAILDSSPSPSGKVLPPLVKHRGYVIEYVDHGAYYYRHYFYSFDHQNLFGTDEQLGPVAISVRREKVDPEDRTNNLGKADYGLYQYRIICRTSQLTTLRGSLVEEAVGSSGRLSSSRGVPLKDVLEVALGGEVSMSCLRHATPGPNTTHQLLKLDEQGICTTYKVGIMYCRAGQSSEEEMYNNECGSLVFDEFLNLIGQKVRLKGFDKYRGGLDCKTDTTGLHSYYTTFNNNEIMFHVSTILPFTPNNHQQLLRKRHIGNDIVTIVFQEPGAQPFSPRTVRSQFQHVFIIVRVSSPNTENTRYSLAVSRSKDVPPFGPPIPDMGSFPKSPEFVDFLMAKIINAENAAHRSEKFRTMAQRTRQEYLKDLATNFCTNNALDSGSKLSKFALGSGRKKEKTKQRVVPDMYTKGALVWSVQVEDLGSAVQVESVLAIAADTLVLMDCVHSSVIFTLPTSSLIGWTLQASSIRLYYGQGECILLRPLSGDMEEMTEIITRLTAVSQGTETMKLVLKRNGLGQLGFHIQGEGIVTDVEPYGFAWEVGLRKGSRLVEICKVATTTLSHDQIVDLLRTSAVVKVVVVPPLEDGTPRGDGRPSMSGSRSSISTPTAPTPHPPHPVPTPTPTPSPSLSSATPSHYEGRQGGSSSAHGYSDSTLSSGRGSDDGRGSSLYRAESELYAGSGHSHDGHLSSGDELHSRSASHDSSDYSLSSNSRRGLSSSGRQAQASLRRGEGSSYLNMEASGSSAYLTGTDSVYSSVSQHSTYTGPRRQFATMDYASGSLPATGNIALELLKQTQNTKYLLGQEPPPNAHPAPPPTHLTLTPTSAGATFGEGGGGGPTYHGASLSSSSLLSLAAGGGGGGGKPELPPPPVHRDDTFPRRKESSHLRKAYASKKHLDHSPMSSNNSSPRSSSKNLSGMSSEESLNTRHRAGVLGQQRGPGGTPSGINFQEELKRLIDPDISESDLASLSSKPPSRGRSGRLQRTYSDESLHSTKGSVTASTTDLVTPGNDLVIGTDVIFTTTSTVPKAAEGAEKTACERLSPRAVADVGRPRRKLPDGRTLPDAMSLDWTDLVHVATKAIESDSRPPPPPPLPPQHSNHHRRGEESDDEAPPPPRPPSPKDNLSLTSTAGLSAASWLSLSSSPEQRVKELEMVATQLQQDLDKERRRSSKLETEIQDLRAENVRLQEESQTAAAQLRRFTEWFFNTIDRQ